MARILIVDDEENIRSSLDSALSRRGHEVMLAANFAEGKKLASNQFDVTFLDVMLPDGSGLDLMRSILKDDPQRIVVMISGHADIDMAVKAIREGVYDFIEKPLSLDRVMITIDNATRASSLLLEKDRLSSIVYGDFIGESESIKKLHKDIAKSAAKTTRFLILGENGTGKELIAHRIHRQSAFSKGPFVAVNCAALPAELVEAELFGHTAGAFTGASKKRKGRFLEADQGTLFLDEISEMPLNAQAKILRVLETRTLTQVGSDKSISFEGNIIAATNRDLAEMVEQNKFRQDLFYRLNVVQFELPPLRDRREDIPLLADYFLAKFAAETNSPAKSLTARASTQLASFDFPGNTRELKNLMERINIYCDTTLVDDRQLLSLLPDRQPETAGTLKETVDEYQSEVIRNCIAHNKGNMTETARELGIERSLLYKKIKRLGISS